MADGAPRAVYMPSGVVVHFLRTDPVKALCGMSTHPNRAGAPVEVDPTVALPLTEAGRELRYCPACVGHFAAQRMDLEALVWRLR